MLEENLKCSLNSCDLNFELMYKYLQEVSHTSEHTFQHCDLVFVRMLEQFLVFSTQNI